MNYKTTLILVGVLLIFGTPAFTQTSLRGSVVSEAGEKIESYLLVLQSPKDLSVVAVKMFSDTVFWFGGIKPKTYLLRVQDVQYQPYDTLITVVEGANVLKAPLVLKPRTLGEAIIQGSRQVLSHDEGNYTVDVANSYLKDDISLTNILGKLPSVVVKGDGGISMFGKDKLQIYINDMKASSAQLNSLQPLDIDKIEVIRNVGSEYDADIDAVIKIKTRKKRDEDIFVSLDNKLYIKHYMTNHVNLSLYLGHNEKLSQHFTYGNKAGKGRSHSRSYIYTYFDDYRNCNLRDDKSVAQGQMHDLFYSLNYSVSKNKDFGVQYSGYFSDIISNRNGVRLIYHDEALNKTVDLKSKEINKSHNSTVNLNYKQRFNDISELSVIADYVIKNVNGTTDITESSIDGDANNFINNDNSGKVISINPNFKIAWKKYYGNIGVKYSYLNSHSLIKWRPSLNEDYSQVSEQTGGAYIIFGANSFIDIKSGLRLEYTSSEIRYEDLSNNLTRSYLNLFPHLSISKKVNNHFSLTAYYRRTISRPRMDRVSTTVTYRDSLHYAIGNPHLKPAFTDALNFNVNWRKFDLSLGYSIYKDQNHWEFIPDSSNPNRTIDTWGNMKGKNKVFTAELSYSFNNRVFSSITSITCRKSDLSMPFNNEMIRLNRPIYSIRHAGNWRFLKNTSLNYLFRYWTPGDDDYIQQKSRCNLEAGITQHLFDRKLMITLYVEDILLTSRLNNRWSSYSNNIAVTHDDRTPDTRYVFFTVRYNFGKGKNKSIQKKMSDTDHIGRL
jgi:hypothetical protein